MATLYPPSRPSWIRPIYAMLSAYPLAFFTGALLTDIVYANSAQMMWANFSIWMLTAGLLIGAVAAFTGLAIAVIDRRRGRRWPWPLTIATALTLIVALFNAFVHSRDAWTSVVPTGLILSVIVAVLALVTSWLGYSLDTRETR